MLDLKHGGHVVRADAKGAHDAEEKLGVRLDPKPPVGTPFDYMLPELTDDAPAAQADPAVEVNSNIPAVYTYWGQFIDHDMTANTDRDSATSDITRTPLTPVPPADVTASLRNLRRPTFDLDNVYGNGPGLDPHAHHPDPGPPDKGFYDGIRLRVGKNDESAGIPGAHIPPVADVSRDLPRIGPLLAQGVITEADIPDSLKTDVNKLTRAFIGDLRNDENLIVSQFHLSFLRFHNNVVAALEADPHAPNTPAKRFAAAQRLVRFHYQWLVVNDYLKTVTLPGMVDKVLVGGNKFYKPLAGGELFAPLEYSVAAYRFGHSMVRAGYDHNRNFGKAVPPTPATQPFAKFEDLFRFTGNGHAIDPNDITKSTPNPFRGLPTLPFNWVIEWDRFANKSDANEGHFARKIDTHLALPILNMVNEGTADGIQDDVANPANKALRQLLRSLAQRNLLRGYLLSLPTGQAVAAAMGIDPLTADELQQGNTADVNTALRNGGFVEHTPLWYYILKEAEIRANGNTLGELGSRIVVETQIGIMRNDANSYLNADHGWDPSKGVKLANGDPIVTIRDFFKFADLAA
jgi:hypothetical protein